MRPQRKPQANDVREEQQDCGEPTVWSYSSEKESIIDGWSLGEVTASAVFIWSVIMATSDYNTLMTIELVLGDGQHWTYKSEGLDLHSHRSGRTGWDRKQR